MGEFIQNYYPYINSRMLYGAVTVAPKPTFTLDNWMSGMYQDSLMKEYEEDLGIHKGLIRFNNQVGYSVFNEIKAHNVVEGKNRMLFESAYIYAYYGRDFVGDTKVKENVSKLKYVQDELKKRNIDMLFVVCCGKASYNFENIPEQYNDSVKTKTNYDAYIEAFAKEKINYVDTRTILLKLKSNTKHPLFPSCGVHWSIFAASIAADTVLKKMEELHKMDMPDYHYEAGELSDTARYSDDDIGKAMNLIYDVPQYPLYYPKIVYKKDSTKTKPNVLLLGDSFLWTWMEPYHYPIEMFSNKSSWWYYSQELEWPAGSDGRHIRIEKLNLKEETLNRDFILIVYNEANLVNFDYGFANRMYNMLKADSVASNK